MEKIAIIGVGQTKQERNKKNQNFAEMVYEATQHALADAGIEIKDIDNVITVSNDFWDGRTISSMAVQDAAGAFEKNVSTVEGDGTFGAYYAMTRVLSGSYKNTLVVAHSKGSESDTNLITNGMFEPIFTRPLGLDNITTAALQARAYMEAFSIKEEDFAAVAVKNHANSLKNPNAQIAKTITISDVMQSKKYADPLKLYDISPITDGAAALILSGDTFLQKLKGGKAKPVYVKGAAFCSDAYDLGLRDLARSPALQKAAATAYRMAGIKTPAEEIHLAELYDAFSYMELMWYEGLAFCDEGKGADFIRSGKTQLTGALPVNASGGVLSAHAVITAGLIRMIEAALQIRGDAGAHQVGRKVETALAHGINGPCAQAHCVWVLGKEA
ncbi:MAG TPA: thiolase family protein [Turneriella sp.]|nr:thiolase family protein [Turneriella sp.]